VLVRQGLTQLAAALGLSGAAYHRHRGGGTADAVAPRNLRLAREELGPTFVKLAQLLSTRGDLLPPVYRAELGKLQDAAPVVSGTVVEGILEQELGREAFAWLDLQPLASASIGQAHAARLHDGTEVVVKVRRPGAREQIEQDLAILEHRARQAGRHLRVLAHVDWVGLAGEVASSTTGLPRRPASRQLLRPAGRCDRDHRLRHRGHAGRAGPRGARRPLDRRRPRGGDARPDFQIVRALAPFARHHVLAQLSPTELLHRLERLGLAAAEFPDQSLPSGLPPAAQHRRRGVARRSPDLRAPAPPASSRGGGTPRRSRPGDEVMSGEPGIRILLLDDHSLLEAIIAGLEPVRIAP
jgi:ABC1 family protein